MKLLSSNLQSGSIIEQLQNTQLTIDMNLLELVILCGHYGNTSPYESLGNVNEVLGEWKVKPELIKEIEHRVSSNSTENLLSYTDMSGIVLDNLRKLGVVK